MKQSISPLLLVLLLCIVLPSAVCTGSKSSDFGFEYNNGFDSTGSGGDIIPIVVVVIPSDDERSLPPISATYDNGTIDFEFYANIGTLYTVVTNESTGERWSDYIDSAEGFYTMNIATQYYQGAYSITLNAKNNKTYGGNFTLK